MKEFEFIDRVMPDVPPPSPAQVAAVRARIATEAAGSRRAAPAARGRGWRGVVLAAAAVALVIAAIVVMVPRTGVRQVAATPERLLELAAAKLAAQPQGAGRYWRLETEEILRSKDEGDYTVENRGRDVLVIGRDNSRYTWFESVSAKPYSTEDTEAWKRSGSPRLCPARGCDKNLRFYPRRDPEHVLALADGWEPTVKEVLALPREAKALKAELLRHRSASSELSPDDWVLQTGARLVRDVPAAPGTRAAVYRMLATMPGVSVLDDVRDPMGRQGVTLQLPTRGADRVQLVIDPRSGELLAVQHMAPMPGLPQGVPWSASIIKKAGWSDARPVPPPNCDGCASRH
ncbi:CU044_5270 family protein [Nonomuraea sp. NPDC050786]|uniref:CU044_5270 family protein n=1 Tax=Nonomuraea sp. NPDC050786 TaxID=3154840 RepID=UPI003403D02D